MRIEIIPDTSSLKSPPDLVGPKSREIYLTMILKQLEAGVSEPAARKWTAEVMFEPQGMDGYASV